MLTVPPAYKFQKIHTLLVPHLPPYAKRTARGLSVPQPNALLLGPFFREHTLYKRLRFVGGQDTFDYRHGPLFIDENFVTCRGPGDAIPIHEGGGHDRCKKMSYGYHNGSFYCGQVNALIGLTKTGPGDGETMLIRGSHKANIVHPDLLEQGQARWVTGGSLDAIPGAVSVFVEAGDAIIFVDCCCHGSAKRTAEGERRFAAYRYGSTSNRTSGSAGPSSRTTSSRSRSSSGCRSQRACQNCEKSSTFWAHGLLVSAGRPPTHPPAPGARHAPPTWSRPRCPLGPAPPLPALSTPAAPYGHRRWPSPPR